MKRQSNYIRKNLRNWINNKLFKSLNSKHFEIESILYFYDYDEKSNL
jgi:hypothetical protein